jgi:hypothetical protein
VRAIELFSSKVAEAVVEGKKRRIEKELEAQKAEGEAAPAEGAEAAGEGADKERPDQSV